MDGHECGHCGGLCDCDLDETQRCEHRCPSNDPLDYYDDRPTGWNDEMTKASA
jgi:hypothetical protein